MDEPTPVDLRRVRRLDPLRRLSPGGFRTIELNVVGWGALVGAGLAAGALSMGAGTPAVAALPGGVVTAWLVVLALDYRRWRRGHSGIGHGGLDPVSGDEIVARLRSMGIDATYEEQLIDEPDGTLYLQRSIRCRHPDARKVERVMDEVLRR